MERAERNQMANKHVSESGAAVAGAATGSASRLWRVTVEYELLVVADNEREAESEGEYYAGEDGSEPGMVIAHQVRTVEEIPREWRQAIPFGGDRDDERTCVERVTQNEKLTDGGPVSTDCK